MITLFTLYRTFISFNPAELDEFDDTDFVLEDFLVIEAEKAKMEETEARKAKEQMESQKRKSHPGKKPMTF